MFLIRILPLKLSKRLDLISKHVYDVYDHIWDCCCDHGLLGAHLLNRNISAQIHFVDIVPTILDTLTQQLAQFYPQTESSPKWAVHCLDVALLPLNDFLNKKHLVIIAGIGGELTAKLVAKIIATNPTSDVEFILCPVHHTYQLRKQLIALKLNVLGEHIINENKRFYELIHVSKNGEIPLSATGSTNMWQTTDHIPLLYLKKLIVHYKKIAAGQSQNEALLAYQTLLSALGQKSNSHSNTKP